MSSICVWDGVKKKNRNQRLFFASGFLYSVRLLILQLFVCLNFIFKITICCVFSVSFHSNFFLYVWKFIQINVRFRVCFIFLLLVFSFFFFQMKKIVGLWNYCTHNILCDVSGGFKHQNWEQMSSRATCYTIDPYQFLKYRMNAKM